MSADPNPTSPAPETPATDGVTPLNPGPAPADAGAAPGLPPSFDTLLAAAEAKAAEHYELYVRARAEMDNIRKRAQEDVAKAHKFAIEAFAESLLPVRDSLEMALTVASPSVENLREGVQATLRQLSSAFEKNRVLEINPVGEKFDPNRHQAISTVPAASTQPPVAANHVVTVLQKGYLINDRVLRPALVTVAQG